jgi:4-hydroxythreonine-4-phosphate dehydrogenase
LLQVLAAAHQGQPVSHMPVRMMLANDELRVVLVSIHMSLRQAIEAVTIANVLETLRITDQSLTAILGRRPRIGVAGLNPHAGEGGRFGVEEIEIISPAIDMARKQGLQVTGPLAPDTVFMRARATSDHPGEFDVVVAMYHDQGLIPVKYLGIDTGVNVTLGLPLVRTSPDHGTAFDIAGTGRADPASLLAAIRMARQLSRPVPA